MNTALNIVPLHQPDRFVPPTIEQAMAYASEIGMSETEAKKMWYFYDSNGWRVGKNKMKQWKSACAGWHLRNSPDSGFVKAIAKSITPSYSIQKLKAERFAEVKARIKTIRDGVTGLNSYTPEERTELALLKVERDNLSRELGLA